MKEPLPFPEVPSSAFKNLASDSMRDEIMMEEDAAAALSAASKKVAPFLRGNVHKPVAASDASVRGTTPSISPAGSAQSWQEALRREGMIGPHPSLKEAAIGPRNLGLVSPNGQRPFHPGFLGPDTRLPTPEQERAAPAAIGPHVGLSTQAERDVRTPPMTAMTAGQSQRGRINQKVQGLLRAHQAALHNEGTTQPTVPAAGSLPAPTMVNGAAAAAAPDRTQQLRQAKEVIASLDSCGDPTVVQRWILHLEGSENPMKEAEKIMAMLRSLVRQGFCAGTADQAAVQKNRSQAFRGPARLQDPTDTSGPWPNLQTSSPHGSVSRGILATAPNSAISQAQAGRDVVANAQVGQRHMLAKNLADKGAVDSRSIPNGLPEGAGSDADMLSLLRHLKEVGDSTRARTMEEALRNRSTL